MRNTVVAAELQGNLIDSRLVSTAQAVAGARCHESANLLQNYYFAAHACAGALGPKYQTDERRIELGEAEAALRRFVFKCRRGRPALAVAPHDETVARCGMLYCGPHE